MTVGSESRSDEERVTKSMTAENDGGDEEKSRKQTRVCVCLHQMCLLQRMLEHICAFKMGSCDINKSFVLMMTRVIILMMK